MSQSKEAPAASGGAAAWLAWNFALTILVSAFLLFQVQPLISKFILPWFGGSPGVWTTCMVFFQVVLFCGYAYAHVTSRWLSPKAQAVLHLLLIGVAVACLLRIPPSETWKPADADQPALRILTLLGATVGLPYFVLSTTGPLVQAWFSYTYPGRSPYRLYALSNAGSLAALLSYPIFFEVYFDVGEQATMWSITFVVFAGLCGLAAIYLWRLVPQYAEIDAAKMDKPKPGETPAVDRGPPTLLRRVLWLGLAAVATLMLLAVTNHVCMDVAVIPFLWVIPLSLYLLSLIICFDHEWWYQRLLFSVGTLVALLLLTGLYELPDLLIPSWEYEATYVHDLALCFLVLFGVCMLCHGELVKLRPSPLHLTEFYLMVSAGGALGGIFVSLVAPRIFTTYFEWTIGLYLSFVIATIVCMRATYSALPPSNAGLRIAALGGQLLLAVAAVLLIRYWITDDSSDIVYRGRNFYGTAAVSERRKNDPLGRHHFAFLSGTTSHGRQYADPARRREKMAYFSEESGSGRAILHHVHNPDLRVGVVGMGVGTLAAYAEQPSQYFRFYEINPEVDFIARNYFTFLEDCRARYDVVMGDARIALEREESQEFDVIVLDAFTSDSVPVHLLTKEAFDVYLRHLRPNGIIVANITNRYLDLAPVIREVAELNELGITRIHTEFDSKTLIYYSDYMVLTKDQAFLAANPPTLKIVDPERRVRRWTDRYSNLFQILSWY